VRTVCRVDTPQEIEERRLRTLERLEHELAHGSEAKELETAQRKLADALAAPYEHDLAWQTEQERLRQASAALAPLRDKVAQIRFGQFTEKTQIDEIVWR